MVVSAQSWKKDSEFRTLYLFLVSDCYMDLQGSTLFYSLLGCYKENCVNIHVAFLNVSVSIRYRMLYISSSVYRSLLNH